MQQKTDSFFMGKGGGFTGKYENYRIDKNGDVFLISADNQLTLLKKLDKKSIENIFKKFYELDIQKMKFSHPGNMTFYITYSANNKTYEIKWGDHRFQPPQNVQDFFDYVWKTIKTP